MSEAVEASGSTVEDAIDAALEQLGAREDEVEVQILEESAVPRPGGARVRVRLRDERSAEDIEIERETAVEQADQSRRVPPEAALQQATKARAFLEGLLEAMDLDGDVSAVPGPYGVEATIHGPDLAVLIGRHGHTLAALQEVTRAAVQRDTVERAQVTVDIEGYLDRRVEMLQRQAQRAAETVRQTGKSFSFDAMPSRDRKIIHDALTGMRGIATGSEGAEPYRYVVVHPA